MIKNKATWLGGLVFGFGEFSPQRCKERENLGVALQKHLIE